MAARSGTNVTAARLRAGATFDRFAAASMNVQVESAKHLLDALLELRPSVVCRVEPLCLRALEVLEGSDTHP